MHILTVLGPIMLMLAAGAALGRAGFLDRTFIAQLNKLTFWVALPVLIFHSAANAGPPAPSTGGILLAVIAATFLMVGLAQVWAIVARIPAEARGTFVISAFVGNLAYIGIPILAHSLRVISDGKSREMLASAVITMTLMTVLNNGLAVICLQRGQSNFFLLLRKLLENPIVLAGTLGLAWGFTGWKMPLILDRTFETVGGIAIPAALLCIGGSLQMTSLRGLVSGMAGATICKVLLFPLIVWLLARALHLDAADTRVALIFAACPTAALVYTMASQMGGDEPLAAGSIAVSTLAAFASLATVLAIT